MKEMCFDCLFVGEPADFVDDCPQCASPNWGPYDPLEEVNGNE